MQSLARMLVVQGVLALLLVTPAAAQSTGSSAGGSNWGSSSSSSSSSSGSRGGSYSSSSPGSSASYEPPPLVQFFLCVGMFGLVGLLFWGIKIVNTPRSADVSLLRVAIDWRARRFIQARLAELASGDTATDEGRAALLAAAARALREAKLAWIYAGATREAPMPLAQARGAFTKLAVDTRARFDRELIRNADGQIATEDAPELAALPHEGEGVVVVTVLTATLAGGREVDAKNVDDIAARLDELAAVKPSALKAVEIVWSPSAEHDRMSTAELEARYPELTRLTEVGGRVFCGYCAGPHTAELAECPHCGAPVGAPAGA